MVEKLSCNNFIWMWIDLSTFPRLKHPTRAKQKRGKCEQPTYRLRFVRAHFISFEFSRWQKGHGVVDEKKIDDWCNPVRFNQRTFPAANVRRNFASPMVRVSFRWINIEILCPDQIQWCDNSKSPATGSGCVVNLAKSKKLHTPSHSFDSKYTFLELFTLRMCNVNQYFLFAKCKPKFLNK